MFVCACVCACVCVSVCLRMYSCVGVARACGCEIKGHGKRAKQRMNVQADKEMF